MAGDRVVTVRDVAALAGVSRTTTARVMGGYGYVSASARTRVLAAAEHLKYVPNEVARALSSGETGTIGLVVGDIGNPFFAAVTKGISAVIEPAGLVLLLACSDERPAVERQAVQTLRGRRVDGLIVASCVRSGAAHLTKTVQGGTPLVLLDRLVRGVMADSVVVDNVGGARTAVRHLLDYGHRRVGLVGDLPQLSSSRERIEGYRKALAEAGIPQDPALVDTHAVNSKDAYQSTIRLCNRPDRPTALFTTSNLMTLGAMRALRDLPLRVPDDISLVGFDDLEWTTLVDPPVTVVEQPTSKVGEEVGHRIINRLGDHDSRPVHTKLPARLIDRGSCAKPATLLSDATTT